MSSTDSDTSTTATFSNNFLAADVRSLNPYYASSYFSNYYFYGGWLDATPVNPSSISGRDATSYSELVALLEAIDVFDSVVFGDPTLQMSCGANSHPLAVVIPRGWSELDQTDPAEWTRRVSFTIRIIVRMETDSTPFAQLDSLAILVQSQVDQADLGGQCIPALTKIRSGSYGTSNQYPEWSIDLEGEFAELIDPMAAIVIL